MWVLWLGVLLLGDGAVAQTRNCASLLGQNGCDRIPQDIPVYRMCCVPPEQVRVDPSTLNDVCGFEVTAAFMVLRDQAAQVAVLGGPCLRLSNEPSLRDGPPSLGSMRVAPASVIKFYEGYGRLASCLRNGESVARHSHQREILANLEIKLRTLQRALAPGGSCRAVPASSRRERSGQAGSAGSDESSL